MDSYRCGLAFGCVIWRLLVGWVLVVADGLLIAWLWVGWACREVFVS